METGLIIIFWYGILHAFGPDHLSAIADFSIGTARKKTLMIVSFFALGHGLSLLLFAKILASFHISDDLLAYGDTISAVVIIMIGVYLLYMVASDKIHLRRHEHEGKEHVHIWFGKAHDHRTQNRALSAFSLAVLMGIGGVRGMLVTLGVIESASVDWRIIIMFVLGVSVVFLLFGVLISEFNARLLDSRTHVKKSFAAAGVISVAVGINMLF